METITEKPIEIIRDSPLSETREEPVCIIKEVFAGFPCLCDLYMGPVAVLRNVIRPRCWAWLIEHCTDETKYREERMNETLSDASTVGSIKQFGAVLYGSVSRAVERWKSRK